MEIRIKTPGLFLQLSLTLCKQLPFPPCNSVTGKELVLPRKLWEQHFLDIATSSKMTSWSVKSESGQCVSHTDLCGTTNPPWSSPAGHFGLACTDVFSLHVPSGVRWLFPEKILFMKEGETSCYLVYQPSRARVCFSWGLHKLRHSSPAMLLCPPFYCSRNTE